MSEKERDKLLLRAGILRFEQKSSNYIEQIRCMERDVSYETSQRQIYDLCLLTALAEALGYGRNRAFFRAAGFYILGLTNELPEPLGRMPAPSPLDTQRLQVLHHLILAWRDLDGSQGAWQGLHTILMSSSSLDEVLDTIRNLFIGFGLSLTRTDILLCNVIFPFAAAVALLEHDDTLAECALALYLAHPGLSSNRITRMMSQQLHLQGEPRGSCQQQGLHHMYQETCKEKRCILCIAGRDII
jgi:hypothetical protein